jgi:hypothetical protein
MNDRSGYTLVELLIFLAISAVVVVAFTGILVVTVQIQGRQSSAATVQQESTALLQQVQYYVQNAALVDIPVDTPTSTLVLRMSSSTQDPTTITLATSTGIVYIQEGSNAPQPLTSGRVAIANLTFVRHANPPAHDSVEVTFTANATTNNIANAFAQAFRTTVTQVSAASFDSNIVPSSTNTYSLGTTGAVWNNINGVIYFNGSNVGIGTASALAPLEVQGSDLFVYNPSGASYITLRDASGNCWEIGVGSRGLTTATTSCSTP